jgi:hypothetical protein
MGRIGWLAGQPISRSQVATGTLRRYSNVAMEQARIPTGITAAVAGVTVGRGRCGDRLVRNVGCMRTVRRGKCAGVARSAGVGHRHLAVIPCTGLPCGSCCAVATYAIGSTGREVRGALACGSAAVVASRTGRGIGVCTVVGLGPKPAGGGRVATLAVGCYPRVDWRG